jgi:hypothetical protein
VSDRPTISKKQRHAAALEKRDRKRRDRRTWQEKVAVREVKPPDKGS